MLLKRPLLLGLVITPCAAFSAAIISQLPPNAFTGVYLGVMPQAAATLVSGWTRWALLIGNLLCIPIGLLLLLAPQWLTRLEAITDNWYSVRKHTRKWTEMHTQPDQWVLAHPSISGITLILLSLGLGVVVSLELWH